MIVRSALRSLARSPGFTAVAVLVLGVGIGAVTATWSLVDRVLLTPLPVLDQSSLVVAWHDEPVRGFDHYPFTVSAFAAVTPASAPAFAAVAAVASAGATDVVVETVDGVEIQAWASVLGDYFGVLGVEAVVGRTLSVDDDVPSPAAPSVVISESLWASRYGRSPTVLGEVLRTRFGNWTIVGVVPADLDFPSGAEVWMPTRARYPLWDSDPPRLELDLVGRLATGATADAAAEQIDAAMRSSPELTGIYANARSFVYPFQDVVVGSLRPVLLVLLGGAVLVLLVAVLDVASLVLVRSETRRGRSALLRALGAGRDRLVAEASIEAGLIALASVLVGVLTARALLGLLIPLAPTELPRLDGAPPIGASAWIIAFACGVGAVGLGQILPTWRLMRADSTALAPGRAHPGTGPDRTKRVLVGGQVALCAWILVAGGLLVRTVQNLSSVDFGFEPAGVYLVSLDHAGPDVEAAPDAVRNLLAATSQMRQVPEVAGLSPVQMPPLPGNSAWQTILFRADQTRAEALESNPFLHMEFVESDYFGTMRLPVTTGRGFLQTDRPEGVQVAVVSESAAALYWPGRSPIGQEFRVAFPGYDGVDWVVVGVAGDTRYGGLTNPEPTVYFPLTQLAAFTPRYLLVRTDRPERLLDRSREVLGALAPTFRPTSVLSVTSRLAAPLARPKFTATVVALLAMVALLLAVVGMYAVMSYFVRARRAEIGVHVACGASPGQAGRLVVRRGASVAFAGMVAGLILARTTGAAVEALLFGVAATDPLTLAGAGLLALFTPLAACLVPALHASRVDAARLLRSE